MRPAHSLQQSNRRAIEKQLAESISSGAATGRAYFKEPASSHREAANFGAAGHQGGDHRPGETTGRGRHLMGRSRPRRRMAAARGVASRLGCARGGSESIQMNSTSSRLQPKRELRAAPWRRRLRSTHTWQLRLARGVQPLTKDFQHFSESRRHQASNRRMGRGCKGSRAAWLRLGQVETDVEQDGPLRSRTGQRLGRCDVSESISKYRESAGEVEGTRLWPIDQALAAAASRPEPRRRPRRHDESDGCHGGGAGAHRPAAQSHAENAIDVVEGLRRLWHDRRRG